MKGGDTRVFSSTEGSAASVKEGGEYDDGGKGGNLNIAQNWRKTFTETLGFAPGTVPTDKPQITGAKTVERTLYFRYTLPARRQRAVRQGDWKLLLDGANPMLFNLRDDLGERNDLASQRSDIVRKLFPLIGAWEQDVDAEAKGAGSTP